MKEKLLWLGVGLLLIGLLIFSGHTLSGRLSGHYRVVGGSVDLILENDIRLINGSIELHFNPSRRIHIIEIEKLESQEGEINFTIPLPDDFQKSVKPGSVVRIPWSGHYNIKSPPVVLITARVDGEIRQVELGIKK